MPSNTQPTLLGAALSELEKQAADAPSVPTNQAQVGVVANQTDGIALVGHGDEPLGHGFDVIEQGKLSNRTGWSLGAWLRWRK